MLPSALWGRDLGGPGGVRTGSFAAHPAQETGLSLPASDRRPHALTAHAPLKRWDASNVRHAAGCLVCVFAKQLIGGRFAACVDTHFSARFDHRTKCGHLSPCCAGIQKSRLSQSGCKQSVLCSRRPSCSQLTQWFSVAVFGAGQISN